MQWPPWNTYSVHKASSLWLVGVYVNILIGKLHSQLLFACYTAYEMASCACVWYVHCYLVGLTAHRSMTGAKQHFVTLQK